MYKCSIAKANTHNYNTYLNGIGHNYNIYIYICRYRYGCVQTCVFLLKNHKLYDFVTPILSKSFWLCWEWLPVLCAEQWGSLCLDRKSLYIGKLASITLQETSISQLGTGISSSQLPLDRICQFPAGYEFVCQSQALSFVLAKCSCG